MAQQQPARRKMQTGKPHSADTRIAIPDKLYFRIGDVARLCELQPYVLRYWETEFPQLKPNKGGTGQRLYRRRDVEMVLEIKHLLYNEGFTIVGARRLLAEKRRTGSDTPRLQDEAPAIPAGTSPRIAILAPEYEVVAPVPVAASTSAEQIFSIEDSAQDRPRNNSTSDAELAAAPTNSAPRLKELRQEMQEILRLLGTETPEAPPAQARSRRESKKAAARLDEPTLFS